MVCLPAKTSYRRTLLKDTGRLRLGALNGGRLVFALRRRPSSVHAAAGVASMQKPTVILDRRGNTLPVSCSQVTLC